MSNWSTFRMGGRGTSICYKVVLKGEHLEVYWGSGVELLEGEKTPRNQSQLG